ncbi:MAG: lipoyl synthase [bacterium]|nr:lipoyl synthase [bacterium]
MPPWLLRRLPPPGLGKKVNGYLKNAAIETICTNSRCPNMCECYSTGNVSFLILGNVCTRNCLFCAVKKGEPTMVDNREPQAIADAVKKLRLQYVVITSVTRDDLPDGGAGHYGDVVKAVKRISPLTTVEVLTPDFVGAIDNIESVVTCGIDVFSHNMETVERLYPKIRPMANYSRSLKVLASAASHKKVPVKSGFMLGLGEAKEEIFRLMEDIRGTGCDFLTIGQYLSPKGSFLKIEEYVHPDIFESLKTRAHRIGFKKVASGPFVRSSYKAKEVFA